MTSRTGADFFTQQEGGPPKQHGNNKNFKFTCIMEERPSLPQ